MKFIIFDTGGQYVYNYDPKSPPEWIQRANGVHTPTIQPTHDLETKEEIQFSDLETVSA